MHGRMSPLDWFVEDCLLLVILVCVAYFAAGWIAGVVKRAAVRRARTGRTVNLSRRAL